MVGEVLGVLVLLGLARLRLVVRRGLCFLEPARINGRGPLAVALSATFVAALGQAKSPPLTTLLHEFRRYLGQGLLADSLRPDSYFFVVYLREEVHASAHTSPDDVVGDFIRQHGSQQVSSLSLEKSSGRHRVPHIFLLLRACAAHSWLPA